MTIRYKKVFIFTALVILTLSLHAMTSEVSIELLAEKLQMEKGTLATRLQSNEYSLVPLINQREHRELWSAILSPDKFEYMQYYATGKKRTEQEMDKAFYDRLRRMWEIDGLPEMLSFISVYKGSPSGQISVGSLIDPLETPSLGYVTLESFSGKGVATANVTMTVQLLSELVEVGRYHFHEITATCHPDNKGSSSALRKVGFRLVESGLLTKYGLRDSYSITLPLDCTYEEHHKSASPE